MVPQGSGSGSLRSPSSLRRPCGARRSAPLCDKQKGSGCSLPSLGAFRSATLRGSLLATSAPHRLHFLFVHLKTLVFSFCSSSRGGCVCSYFFFCFFYLFENRFTQLLSLFRSCFFQIIFCEIINLCLCIK